ncbi:MAG: hypothetical protein ACYDB5_10640 [bacterium]
MNFLILLLIQFNFVNISMEIMEIQIDPHTLERAQERGSNEIEIKDVILTDSCRKAPCFSYGDIRQ